MNESYLEKLLAHCSDTRSIAVVGDPMIDEYFYVTANRVSPEFPIPVMHSWNQTPQERVPGGAANICHQLTHFNIHTCLFAAMTKDDSEFMDSYNIHNMTTFCQNPIPVKRRLYQDQFPLCRWDIETKLDVDEYRKQVSNNLKCQHNKKPYDIVVYSDYNKGLFQEDHGWIDAAKGAITIVDPKDENIDKWKGCTIFKPNTKEAKDISGLSKWEEQVIYFQEKLDCKCVIITCGGEGLAVRIDDKSFFYHPDKRIDANSVIGAGDCFLAFLSMSLAYGLEIDEAIDVAYNAGAIYVQRKHNKPISIQELKEFYNPIMAKSINPDQLIDRDYKLVFANGCFDMMHAGHIDCLNKAKQLGDKLVVALNTDESISRLKGKDRPVTPLEQRKYSIASLDCVDYVVDFSEDTPENLINLIKPDIIVKGKKIENVVGEQSNAEIRFTYENFNVSTTDIINKIKQS